VARELPRILREISAGVAGKRFCKELCVIRSAGEKEREREREKEVRERVRERVRKRKK